MEARRMAGARPHSRRCESPRAIAEPRTAQLNFERAVFALSATVLVAAAVGWAFPLRPCEALSSEPIVTTTVTVQPGDTVWGIARRVSGDDADLRRVVYSISQLNNLENAVIRPGQAILVPAEQQLGEVRSASGVAANFR